MPTNTPRRVANLWLDYGFAPGWKVTFAAREVSKSFADDANTIWMPGYRVFDAGIAYRVTRDVKIEARMRNLADKVYAIRVTGTPMAYLGEPRGMDLTLRVNF